MCVQTGTGQQDILEAFDAALAASAARTEEAQSAAARLATQLAELELQVQQLQLICGAQPDAASLAEARARPKSGTPRADGAAVVRAVASAEARSPEKQRSPCRNGFAAGAAADGCGGRGVRALRQHQTHLEQQLAKQTAELTQLQRENIRLMRYKKQYEVAAQSLQASAGAKVAAEAYAQEAGLRAAAAGGRADKLDIEVCQCVGRAGCLMPGSLVCSCSLRLSPLPTPQTLFFVDSFSQRLQECILASICQMHCQPCVAAHS
jgi:hypothetical protein